ncbi:MAG: hypothetical protein P4L87_04770 [Formivibrio sp.]|nr:hypothetical protein [Formivibrio sp.]
MNFLSPQFCCSGRSIANVLMVSLALIWPVAGQASGGGGYSELVSYSLVQPEPAAMAGFVQGKLGILGPGTDRFYLMAAYRIMQGLPALSGTEQARLLQETEYLRAERSPAGVELWLQQRNAVADKALASRPGEGYLERGDYAYTSNCLPDAFEFAATTLAQRQAAHGQENEAIQAWIHNQDSVFASCDLRNKPVPELSLPTEAPQWLQHDFAYQLAAQQLYLAHYPEAIQAFEAIAKDTTSPWHEWAGYLAIRSWWRERFNSAEAYQRFRAETGEWPQHEQARALLHMIESAHDDSVRKAARGLYDSMSTRFAPDRQWQQQWRKVNAAQAPDDLAQWVSDQRWLWALLPESAIADDWLFATRSASGGKDEHDLQTQQQLIARWEKTRALPWLASAMMVVRVQTPGRDALVAASKEVKPDHPLFLHLAWYRVRLALETGDWVAARKELEALQPQLRNQSQGTRQAFDVLAMLAADSLDGVAKHFVRAPIGIVEGEDEMYYRALEPGKTYPDYLDGAALGLARTRLSGEELLDLAKTGSIANPVRLRLAGEAWRRAALTDVAPLEQAAIQQWAMLDNSAEVQQLAHAGSSAEQRFLLARKLLLNQVPGLRLGTDIDSYGLEDASPDARLGELQPAFHDSAQQAAVAIELERYKHHNETEWLGQQILPWMKRQPKFAEGPAILEKLVYASRYRDRHTETSRDAFKLLHAQYPQSAEALRTRYYY